MSSKQTPNFDVVISCQLVTAVETERQAGSSPLRISKQCLVIGLALPIALGLAGCGGPASDAPPLRAAVMGTVTLDGELLERGVIRFIPSEGTSGPQTTAVIDEGIFTLPADHGPVVGNHRVEIKSTDTGGLAMDDEHALEQLQAQSTKPHIEVVRVPIVYNERSKLTAQVPEAGTSELNFVLVSNPD